MAEAEQVYQDLILLAQVVLEEAQEVAHQILDVLEQETHHLFHNLKVILVLHQVLTHQVILVVEAEAVLRLLVKQVGQTIITVEMVELVLLLILQEVLWLEQVVAEVVL